MRNYKVWLEPNVVGVRFEYIVEVPINSTEEEIEEICRETAFDPIDWGYDPLEEETKC